MENRDKKRSKYDKPIKKISKKKKKRTQRTKLADVPKRVDYDIIEKLYASGLIEKNIAAALGLSERTLNRYKHAAGFMAVVKKGREKANDNVEVSLYKRAIGYEYAEMTLEPVLAVRQVDGKKEKMMLSTEPQVTKIVTKHIPGDVNAQLEWLYNRKPKEWQRKIDVTSNNEKIAPTFVVPAFSGNVIRLPVGAGDGK